jgi:hypothetical protein
MIRTSPHIAAEQRLTRRVLILCLSSGLAIGAAAGNLLGTSVLWCWLGIFVIVLSATAGGLGSIR